MRARYQYEIAGHNFRMTELQAAVAIPQLARLRAATDRRSVNAGLLSEGLAGIPGLAIPRELPGRSHVWHQYTLRVTEESGRTREEVAAHLDEAGIGSGFYYPRPVYDYDCYRDHPGVVIEEHPVATQVSGQVLSIPVHPALSAADIDQIISAVRGAFDVD